MPRRTLSATAAAVLVALALTSSAHASNNHVTNADISIDPDFCGTGVAVEVAFSETLTEHFTGRPNVDYHQTANGGATYTNLDNGHWVTTSFKTNFTVAPGTGDLVGLHTVEFTFNGVSLMIRSEDNRLLLKDSGTFVFVATFDGEEFLGVEVGTSHGSNPNLESDGALFCEIAVEALAIE
jgi:hypothetical protein